LPKRIRVYSPEQVEAKRVYMKRWRAANTDRARETSRRSYHKNGRGRLANERRAARMKADDPYRWRAYIIRARGGKTITGADLEALWLRQGGLCALTGRPLVMADAQLDHITPLARGGRTEIENLQWTCSAANYAKGDLTVEEFRSLCADVLRTPPLVAEIGRAILRANLPETAEAVA
jgi:5-methylcytosine-specific restriction endonuclease McrA